MYYVSVYVNTKDPRLSYLLVNFVHCADSDLIQIFTTIERSYFIEFIGTIYALFNIAHFIVVYLIISCLFTLLFSY